MRPEPEPTLRPEGEYLQKAWKERVYPLARELGVDMHLPQVSPQPHTHLAHEGGVYAAAHGRGDEWNHAVMTAFFQLTRDIGDPIVLTDIAENVGMDPVEFQKHVLEERRFSAERERLEREAHERGIHAVPTFFIGSRVLQGLYPREAIERVIDEEMRTRKAG